MYVNTLELLKTTPRTWLVTGVAGFIGSNLLKTLLSLDQRVVGLDNFATGFQHNIDGVLKEVGAEHAKNFTFIYGDICSLDTCKEAIKNVDAILHQAALGSVPRSLKDPIATNRTNVDGFLNMLVAAKDAGVSRIVYASSSSVYGDSPTLPKVETHQGNLLSPYSVSKYTDELYANTFARNYPLEVIGLRYFNVFGPRQNPTGPYAAVIPLWIQSLLSNNPAIINGDGETSRDFCFIENAIQANILAATTTNIDAVNQVYNVAFGEQTTLNTLYSIIREGLSVNTTPEYRDFRGGDVRHSLANIDKAKSLLGYSPRYSVRQGLEITLDWYKNAKDHSHHCE